MQPLRAFLRIPPINHAAKALARLLLPPRRFAPLERKLPLLDPFSIPLPNSQSIHFLPFGDNCSKFLRFDGWNGYETPSVELFFALAHHAAVTFDVGAYLGYFALLAAAANPRSHAYAFEAVPKLAALCRRLSAANPHLNVEIINAAISDHSGSITLYMPPDPLISDTSTAAAHRPNRKPTTVPALSLDDFVAQRRIPRVDLLKLDTETTEPAVLAGFTRTIARDRPTFLCEVLPTADLTALETFCAANHYCHAWISPAGPTLLPKLVPHPVDFNYIFYPDGPATPLLAELHRRLKAPL